jgi:hypothetical protein
MWLGRLCANAEPYLVVITENVTSRPATGTLAIPCDMNEPALGSSYTQQTVGILYKRATGG